MGSDFWEKNRTANVVVGFFVGVLFLMGGLDGLDADLSLDADAVVTDAVVEDVVSTRDPQYRVRFMVPGGEEVSTRTMFAKGDARARGPHQGRVRPGGPGNGR